MYTKSYVSIRDLPEYCHTFKKLPEHIHHRLIAITDKTAINNNEFFYFYDDKHKKLFLRYFNHNPYPEEFWTMVGIGELVATSSSDFVKRLNSLYKSDKLFFPVVAPVHHNPDKYHRRQVRYFPMPPLAKADKKNFMWDTTIKSIFIPTDSFIESCSTQEEVFDLLKGYFRRYSDFENDENYMVLTDIYDLSSDDGTLIEPVSGQNEVQVIGYENAKTELKNFDIEEFLA